MAKHNIQERIDHSQTFYVQAGGCTKNRVVIMGTTTVSGYDGTVKLPSKAAGTTEGPLGRFLGDGEAAGDLVPVKLSPAYLSGATETPVGVAQTTEVANASVSVVTDGIVMTEVSAAVTKGNWAFVSGSDGRVA